MEERKHITDGHKCWCNPKVVYVPPKKASGIRAKYNELIMSVGNKYPNETRHQTALRYILQAENNTRTGSENKLKSLKT